MFKFEKYQRAILGPSSSDPVTTLEKKFGKTFFWVCISFFTKASQKSGILIKTGYILTKILVMVTKASFLYLNKN